MADYSVTWELDVVGIDNIEEAESSVSEFNDTVNQSIDTGDEESASMETN
jgi:ArsR family metal-binding transcriptional regulator